MIAIFMITAFSSKQQTTLADINKIAPSKDTLACNFKYLRIQDKNCKDPHNCSFAEVSFPMFKTLPALNDTIRNRFLSYLNPRHQSNQNIDSLFNHFAKAYLATHAGSPIAPTVSYVGLTTWQDRNLVTIAFTQEWDGGAHPDSHNEFITWNIKADKKLTLQDILIPGYKKELNKIAEKIFRKQEKLSPAEPLVNYFFKNHTFALNNNYQFSPQGISFFYNNYEIKPYADGATDLPIPYQSIKHLLRPNTVVSPYIK